jgi:copper(I)-binding protein
MNKVVQMMFVFLALAATSTLFAAGKASDSVTVSDPYVRAVPPGQTISAAFMQLENSSASILSIVNATSDVAKVVELHAHVHEDGMMKMRRVDTIDVPANGKAVLQPGGLHIMLIDLHEDLKLDQKVSLTLEFSDGSTTVVEAPVRKIMMKGMMKH